MQIIILSALLAKASTEDDLAILCKNQRYRMNENSGSKYYWYSQVKEMTSRLVRINSVSPSVEGENACAAEIYRLLEERGLKPGYWQIKKGQRRNVWAMMEGRGSSLGNGRIPTVILLGHLDTADIQDYGANTDPFDPEGLCQALLAQYQSNPSTDDELLQDVASGDWLLGRGCFDMKSGVSSQIAVMGELEKMKDQLRGNVLMLAAGDEEVESGGTISAVEDLIRLRAERNLEYIGVINSDYTAPREPGDNQRYIYLGTIGKLLACFYIRGCETHLGEAFRGLDANLIASELVCESNLNVDLCDEADGEITVPPVSLKMRDFKVRYEAQTPIGAVVHLSVLTHVATPQEVLVQAVGLASRALSRANSKRVIEWTRYTARQSSYLALDDLGGRVWTYQQLLGATSRKLNITEEDLRHEVEHDAFAYISKARHLLSKLNENERKYLIDNGQLVDIDSRERSLILVRSLVEIACKQGVIDRNKPFIVVFFAPPFFPPVRGVLDSPLSQAITETVATGKFGDICFRSFYPYVSDLSYMRVDDTVYNSLPLLRANFPLWRDPEEMDDESRQDDLFSIPFTKIRELNCHVANIGPWGRDAHAKGERVFMPYSFETVPELIYRIVQRLLQADPSG
jgi:arginine utilization protein RocB